MAEHQRLGLNPQPPPVVLALESAHDAREIAEEGGDEFEQVSASRGELHLILADSLKTV